MAQLNVDLVYLLGGLIAAIAFISGFLIFIHFLGGPWDV